MRLERRCQLESEVGLIGFLLGFFSQLHADEAYVHFVGVHPDFRRLGLGGGSTSASSSPRR